MLDFNQKPAILALEDGTLFRGISIGAEGTAVGEVVFNTAMTGYQEILTDPSYSRQIITFTYPHIGNVGINEEDNESTRAHCAGMVIRDLSPIASNFRSSLSLEDYLLREGVVAISGIDTRKLTRILRDKGAQNACIATGDASPERALELARSFAGLTGMDLAKEVTRDVAASWTEGSWSLGAGYQKPNNAKYRVTALDFGVKDNILRLLVDRGCEVQVLPAQSGIDAVLATQPDGVFLSNGPGDPEPCDYAIAAARELLERNIPLFGICLGHQILGLAAGANTEKMKFGHHGANHPVLDIETGRVMITSQNHGFAISEENLPAHVIATHHSLFDQSLQGIRIAGKPAFSFQGHPEASPGPHDVQPLFDQFIDLMKEAKAPATGVAQ